MAKDVFDEMSEKWPSAVVARTEIKTFTGGLLSAKSAANLDSLGRGIPGRVAVGRKVIYPISCLIPWLRDRASN